MWVWECLFIKGTTNMYGHNKSSKISPHFTTMADVLLPFEHVHGLVQEVALLHIIPIYGLKIADLGTNKHLNWNVVAVQ
jgi:hypothetical protein